jgi:hypothetical protein
MREDVRRTRRLGRELILMTLSFAIVLGFVRLMEPGMPGGPMLEVPYVGVWPWAAASGLYVVGLGWMVRIYRRSHLEPETSSWRYRDT